MPGNQETVSRQSTVDIAALLRIADGLGVPRALITDRTIAVDTHRANEITDVPLPADVDGFRVGMRVPWPFVGPPEICRATTCGPPVRGGMWRWSSRFSTTPG
jgi:hypothetical protein